MSCCCVREPASKPAILAQASQAHLGEICRDANPQFARGHRSGGEFWGFGEGSSRLGETCLSEKSYEIVCFVEQLAQARVIVVLSGSTSRPSETLSPKRDREGRSVVFRVSSPRRGTFILSERESRPSEHELA